MNDINPKCGYLILLLVATVFDVAGSEVTDAVTVLQWDAKKHIEGPIILGETKTAKILLWSGLGQDVAPWIDVVDQDHGTIKKLDYSDAILGKKISPMIAHLNDSGTRLAVKMGEYLGTYDFLEGDGKSIKLNLDSRFISLPQWFPDTRIAFLETQNWRRVWLYDQSNDYLTLLPTPSNFNKFISTFSIGSNDTIVIAAGPINESMIDSEMSRDTFGIDETRSERINLYQVSIKTGVTKQLTEGRWYDFAPKVSPDGKYIAFLRGRTILPKASAPETDDREWTLSDTKPTLYLYRLSDGNLTKIVQNSLVTNSFDFSWQGSSAILFRNTCSNKKMCVIEYRLTRTKSNVLYRGKGFIRSFYWSQISSRLLVVEDNVDGKSSLIMITKVTGSGLHYCIMSPGSINFPDKRFT